MKGDLQQIAFFSSLYALCICSSLRSRKAHALSAPVLLPLSSAVMHHDLLLKSLSVGGEDHVRANPIGDARNTVLIDWL